MHPPHPIHPLDAASHRNPYPYYRQLLARAPLVYDEDLRLWVAAQSSVVAEVLDNPACRVRPASEPVPFTLSGTPAADVFSRLVRMNDGAGHTTGKASLERALAGLSDDHIRTRAADIACRDLPCTAEDLTDWVYRTPVSVVADLLGFPALALADISRLTRDFVACLSPLAKPDQLAKASLAATALQAALWPLLDAAPAQTSLVGRVCAAASAHGWEDRPAMLANLVGLLSQTYEATGGLLGNCLTALATHSGLLHCVRSRPNGWQELVEETSRYDPSVQNTRRFLHQPSRLAGVDLPAGSTLLLLVAAANRDRLANEHPDSFQLDRPHRKIFNFGRGSHVCPGRALATRVVSVALETLFNMWHQDDLTSLYWRYLPSANGRLPQFLDDQTAMIPARLQPGVSCARIHRQHRLVTW